jgi:hypothetical protein
MSKFEGRIQIAYHCEEHHFDSRSPIVFLEHLMDWDRHKLSFWQAISEICDLTVKALPAEVIEQAQKASAQTAEIMAKLET